MDRHTVDLEDEAAVEAAFGDIAKSLRSAIDQRREMARELRREADEAEKLASRWEAAALKGRWWEAPLNEEEIDLLCSVEPANRADLLDPGG